jgi:DNA-binding transcriptional regulator LsrR (DeoR family)
VPISQTGIARRFGVSRVQVRRLLRDAVRAGLLTTKSHDGECREVTFGAGVAEYLRFLCAAQLAQLLAVAAATARAETPLDAEIKIVR